MNCFNSYVNIMYNSMFILRDSIPSEFFFASDDCVEFIYLFIFGVCMWSGTGCNYNIYQLFVIC